MLKTTAKILLFLHIFKYFFIKNSLKIVCSKKMLYLCAFFCGETYSLYI